MKKTIEDYSLHFSGQNKGGGCKGNISAKLIYNYAYSKMFWDVSYFRERKSLIEP